MDGMQTPVILRPDDEVPRMVITRQIICKSTNRFQRSRCVPGFFKFNSRPLNYVSRQERFDTGWYCHSATSFPKYDISCRHFLAILINFYLTISLQNSQMSCAILFSFHFSRTEFMAFSPSFSASFGSCISRSICSASSSAFSGS